MSDRFWKIKIFTLVKSLDLQQVREIISDVRQDNQQENIINYLDALETVIAEISDEKITQTSELAQLINDASDRAIFNQLETEDNSEPIIVKHLLSGEELNLNLETTLIRNRSLTSLPKSPESANELPCSLQELFWWLWRCLPEAIANKTSPNSLLIPASDHLPDASMWSDASLAAALAGALVGYENETASRPQLVIFSFSPIQEMIKASRKMRDFWAGSWLLHYLSAKVCWHLANKYGADSLVYPSLYHQPLIDRWLLDKYPNFKNNDWIKPPSERSLLTAGFPNVIVAVLPQSKVKGAMQDARQNLLKEWKQIGDRVFDKLTKEWEWMPDLHPDDPTWNGWLKAQWQTYWTALPLGKENLDLKISELDDEWIKAQNEACDLKGTSNLQINSKPLFNREEERFIKAVKIERETKKLPNVDINVGSWWPYAFDQLRFALSSVKKARTWTIPTAFTMRSTISGMGSVVTPKSLSFKREKENQNYSIDEQKRHESWNSVKGVFDDREQLNATETVKRGLHFVLPKLLNLEKDKITASYPDLCSGVAGWLRTNKKDHPEIRQYYNNACQQIVNKFSWTTNKVKQTKPTAYMPWGIPWIDEQDLPSNRKYNPRLLNARWAIEDCPDEDKDKQLKELKNKINEYFSPGNNPTDWYVIAVGDGDGMGEWLKGTKLDQYGQYLGNGLLNNPPDAIAQPLEALKQVPKRMGPSTHNALSRALLDFSNRLLPYLSEERYTGRLIYGGGDDVFAYTNLWEWDKWLWDVRQCFCGADDLHKEFRSAGDYWQWQEGDKPDSIPNRPLFTMGSKATISFGLVIAHHSVPLAIALENVWQAEEEAKEHVAVIDLQQKPKDAVQVRVLFGNGNTIAASSKFEVFHHWQELLEMVQNLTTSEPNSLPGLFELAAQIWKDHPAPSTEDAIEAWVRAFCQRRDILKLTKSTDFQEKLREYLALLIKYSQEKVCKSEQAEECDKQIQNWLKLAAFVLRNREINLKNQVDN